MISYNYNSFLFSPGEPFGSFWFFTSSSSQLTILDLKMELFLSWVTSRVWWSRFLALDGWIRKSAFWRKIFQTNKIFYAKVSCDNFSVQPKKRLCIHRRETKIFPLIRNASRWRRKYKLMQLSMKCDNNIATYAAPRHKHFIFISKLSCCRAMNSEIEIRICL